MYDEPDDKIILTSHSRPIGTLTAIDPKTGDIVGTAELEDNAPEGAAADGKGHMFVNNESKSTIQVIDVKTWKATASWPLAPCEGPTGIAYDKASNRIFSGCSNTSVVVDASTGKVVATIKNGTRVDALGWDPSKKLILHSEWWRRQRHRGPPGFAGQVHGGGYGRDVCRARKPSRSIRRLTTRTCSNRSVVRHQPPPADAPAPAPGRTWTRPSGSDRRVVVYRHQAVALDRV